MKKNNLKFSSFIIFIGMVFFSNILILNATTNDKVIAYWCKNPDKSTSDTTIYQDFSKQYKINDFTKTANCNVNANKTVTCKYSFDNDGMYNLKVISDDNEQIITPKNNKITFTVTSAPGSAIDTYSYPNKNNKTECSFDVNEASKDKNLEKYIYYFTFTLPTTQKNIFYSSDSCENFRNNAGNSNYSIYAKNNVPECFERDSEINILTTAADVNARINTVNNFIKEVNKFTASAKSDGINNLFCQFDTSKNTVNSSSSAVIDSYTTFFDVKDDEKHIAWFTMICTEDVTVSYDSPKASYASGGFKYTVKLKTTKTCRAIPVRQPVKPQICTPSIKFDDTNTPLGGPDSDFDSCVQSCDGGSYSDTCSNLCYSEVYKEGKSIEQISFINRNLDNSFNNIEKLFMSPSDKNGVPWCNVPAHNSVPASIKSKPSYTSREYRWVVCPSIATKSLYKNAPVKIMKQDTKSQAISANKKGDVYGCVYGWQSFSCTGTAKCTNNCSSSSVETEAQANRAFNIEKNLQEQAIKKIKNGTYGDCIADGNGFTCESIDTTEEATREASITRTVKNKGNYLANNDDIVELSVNKTQDNGNLFINFPKAFISLETGKVKYSETNLDSSKYRFGGYLFYTDSSTTSKNSNDIRYYPYNASNYGIKDNIMKSSGLDFRSTYGSNNTKINWNIITKIRNFGSDKQWNIDVNCFYGADVSLCGKDDSDCCEAGGKCEPVECKDCVSGNLPYRYRTVNLDDLFPDRNPRYNWTNNAANEKASTPGYDIDPEALISDIESKGNSIYNDTEYTKLSIGKNGEYSWNTIIKDHNQNSNNLYTEFDGSYSALENGVNFFNSKYVADENKKYNRTK